MEVTSPARAQNRPNRPLQGDRGALDTPIVASRHRADVLGSAAMSTESPITAIILAAGQGTRMKSARPKVLHELAGRPMIHHVIDAALGAGALDVIVVVGHGRDEVTAYLAKAFPGNVRTAVQETQQGTGHAVRCALPSLDARAD